MSKKMTMGSEVLLCLAVLLLPGRAIGQEDQDAAAELYTRAIELSADAAVAGAQYDVAYALQAEALADTIYKQARRALNEAQYRKAVELFLVNLTLYHPTPPLLLRELG